MAAAKKGGLGKGIDSLIPNKVSATKTEAKNENVKNDKVIEGRTEPGTAKKEF